MQPVSVDRWPEDLQNVIEDMSGKPIRVHELLANNPALLSAWWPLRNHCVNGGTLGARLTEILILRTAVRLSSWYEWASHVVRGLAAGLEDADIRSASGDGDTLDDRERTLIRCVDELLEHNRILSEQDASLAFSDEELLDIVVTVGVYRILAGAMGTWPIDVDDKVNDAVPASLGRDYFRKRTASLNGR